jgi:anaerobic selenocysteine-containing dehydrogenase
VGLGKAARRALRVQDGGVAETVTFCPLCVSRCGATATVEDGRLLALRPAPGHPTGQALCVKGKAAPDIVNHPDRLLLPLRRTAPKGAPDPGWEPIGWDDALDTIAAKLTAIAEESGPEAVVFGSASPSTSAMSDSVDWVMRLRRAFGSPNFCSYMELCGWGRYMASIYTYGEPVPGAYMPDLDNAGCILFWGYNPSVARLAHATSATTRSASGRPRTPTPYRRAPKRADNAERKINNSQVGS